MCFTKKKVLDQLPTLKVKNKDIKWVRTFKNLGLTFDAPTLIWKEHIDDTCRQCLQRINIMKAMAGTTWGVDKELLLRIYKVYIRSKLMYGISAVASAAGHRLEQMNRIQNSALRSALGARKTSPITALQVESDIPSIELYVMELCCRYQYKIDAQEDSHPMLQEIQNDPEVENKLWTPGFKLPFIKRVRGIKRWWNLPEKVNFRQKQIPKIPPWEKPAWKIDTTMVEATSKEDSKERLKAVTLATIHERYSDHIQIFTDGSQQNGSTTTAIWVPQANHHDKWNYNTALSMIKLIERSSL